MNDFSTRVCGIPCLVRVMYWERYRPAKVSGPPEHCYTEEGGWGEWEILDTKGRPAPWLEKKMSDTDRQQVDTFLFEQLEGTQI
jgi:hypothetical protein